VEPFYFGDSARPLFGLHHPPTGAERRTAVVVCPPFGQEQMRAHRSLRELAVRLGAAGFHTLRFDLSGTGDSAGEGEDARLERWVADVRVAADEMRELAQAPRVALAGLRLGATLAVLAAAGRRDLAALALWEPIVSGRAYRTELADAHAAWYRDHARGAAPTADEALGFPLPPALAADLDGVDLAAWAPPAAPALWVTSDGGPAVPWATGATSAALPAAPVWLHAEGMDRTLVPGPQLDAIAAWLAEACR
jgi:alpha/beta superfamily hydrolase